MTGSRSCRFWTPMYSRCDAPAELKECSLLPRICVRGLWIMAGECGLQGGGPAECVLYSACTPFVQLLVNLQVEEKPCRKLKMC